MGAPFKVLTNHHSLQWLCIMKREDALLTGWKGDLQDYQFTILHHPGKLQGHVDGLSRMPQPPLVAMVTNCKVVKQGLVDVGFGNEEHLGARTGM